MKYFWIGWCKEENHDKVWGMIDLTRGWNHPGTYISFWGRRGRKLQVKVHNEITFYEAQRMCDKKENNGYRVVQSLETVYPEFEQDLEQTAVWGLLKA